MFVNNEKKEIYPSMMGLKIFWLVNADELIEGTAYTIRKYEGDTKGGGTASFRSRVEGKEMYVNIDYTPFMPLDTIEIDFTFEEREDDKHE
jgi:hypothetical protein